MGYSIKVVRVFYNSGPSLFQEWSEFTLSEFTGTPVLELACRTYLFLIGITSYKLSYIIYYMILLPLLCEHIIYSGILNMIFYNK